MMEQYQKIKAENRDAILFFRLGDFYEMFGSDALEASKILDITLTARNKSKNPVPMCGIPYHAAAGYIDKLTKAGKKVAICDQVSDPALPGIVKREVVRIITPGTTFSEQVLDRKSNQYVLAIFPKKDYFGIAFADLTTGEFQAAELQGKEALQMELLRLEPAEIILQREHYDDPNIRATVIQLSNAPISPCDFYEEAAQFLKENLKVSTLDGFGISNWPFAVQSSALLMRYLLDTQKESMAHIDKITAYHREHWMPLDEATIRNLELFSSIRGAAPGAAAASSREPDGTLLSILDETQTSMGGRMLRRWLVQPLVRKSEIEARHEAVGNLSTDDDFRNKLAEELTRISDLERLLGRLSSSTGTARDLVGLANSLAVIPEVEATLHRNDAKMLKVMERDLEPLEKLTKHICAAILPEPSMKLRDGGMIAPGYNSELDELHGLMNDAKTALKNIEQEEIKATGISSLKVKFNKVFGYYIEVSNTNSDKVPEHYTRKQTLVNAERFVTPELKGYEEKVLHAEEKSKTLEYELFLEVRELALAEIKAIKKNAYILAELDVILAFAINAIRRNYCRPQITDEPILEIREGRHPVVENMTFEKSFTPNDANFSAEEADADASAQHNEIKLITGPNMSGKSTYLRQVALIALMAQIGSFVPATSLRMRAFDRIFTRVGASDNLVRGQSTFMVEMQESAYIINHATNKSLIILDEVGRGTSTYDGMSIAWAILEHLHDSVRGFTLFATHYHELIELATTLPRAKNYSIDVKETRKGVLFLHKIKEGGIDKSYGIEVARIAGLPAKLVERASTILQDLELEKILAQNALGKISENQMDMFSQTYASSREPGKLTHPALEKLKGLDINSLTPIEALNALNELKGLRD